MDGAYFFFEKSSSQYLAFSCTSSGRSRETDLYPQNSTSGLERRKGKEGKGKVSFNSFDLKVELVLELTSS